MKFIYVMSLLVLGFSISASALDFKEARAKGMITEQADGYVVAAKKTPEIEAIVKDVNAKRKEEYTRISKENGQPVDIVAKLAAEQIKKKLNK